MPSHVEEGEASVEKFDLYQDIAMRTQGDIYIGVVGPVRTGKSTFIRNFMEQLVLPAMEDGYAKEQVMDERKVERVNPS